MKKLLILTIAIITSCSCNDDLEKGYLVGKSYTPPYNSTIYNPSVKTIIVNHHEATYQLYFAYKNKTNTMLVDKNTFDNAKLGKLYQIGNFKKIELADE